MTTISYPDIRDERLLPLYVTGIGIECSQPAAARPSLVNPQILITRSGCGIITVADQEYELPAGTGFFLNRGVDYRYGPAGDEWVVDWVTFDFGGSWKGSALFAGEKFAAFRLTNTGKYLTQVGKIYGMLSYDPQYGGYAASAELYSMLITLNREAMEIPEIQQKTIPAITAVIEYIGANYTRSLTLDDLCRASGGLSEQYLCRLFKQSTGMRPVEFILRKRIYTARSLLETTDTPISEIAVRVGFNNTSYFYRNFKKFTGTSPLAYRQTSLE